MTLTYNICYTLCRLILFFGFHRRVIYPERMPQEGGYLMASNHTSFLDPPIVGLCSHSDVFFMARKTLLNIPLLGKLLPSLNLILVERGKVDMSALKVVIRKLRAGHSVLVFPEGTRSPDGSLQPAKPGIGFLIAKTRAPVVPFRIFGSHEAFPKSGGVRLKPITVVVGEVIHFTDEEIGKGEREDLQRLSERVMEAIAALKIPEN